MAVYPLWVTLSHLTFCLYNNYIMYTQKVNPYSKIIMGFRFGTPYERGRNAPYLPLLFISQSPSRLDRYPSFRRVWWVVFPAPLSKCPLPFRAVTPVVCVYGTTSTTLSRFTIRPTHFGQASPKAKG